MRLFTALLHSFYSECDEEALSYTQVHEVYTRK